jgi:ligand-binding SRPBCC domain-containing protein
MPEFVRSVVVHAPIDVVFAFHEREDALPLLTPAFPPVKMVSRSGPLAVGLRVVLRLAGLVTWVAEHPIVERPTLFVDTQVSGPFRRWVHRHEFEAVDADTTRLTERISYDLPGGALLNWAAPLLVTPGLVQMFRHRHQVTRQYCEASPAHASR